MKKLILLALGLSSGTLFAQCFSTGTGIDGGYHATANTTLAGGTYQFTSFTIDPGVTVMVTGTSPLVVNCTGAVTINGTLSASGGNGVDGVTYVSGGIGGTGVAGGGNGGNGSFASGSGPLDGTDGINTGGAGNHGAGWSGGGGGGYAANGGASGGVGGFAGPSYGTADLSGMLSGSGGGGGSGGYDCGAGGGGAGGGLIVINSASILVESGGAILSNGGNGGSDGTGNCGGGGGGSGGTIWLAASTMTNNGLVSAAGGTGGGSNVPGSPYYGTGANGSAGRIRIDVNTPVTGSGGIVPAAGFTSTLLGGNMTAIAATCPGSDNGSATINASGGTGPYSYLWTSGETTPTATGLAAGTQTVTVTDDNGCSMDVDVTIPALASSSASQTFTLCNGESVTVGSNTYTTSGIYEDTLTNALGCDSTITTNLTVLPAYSSSQTFNICAGESVSVGDSTYSATGTYMTVLNSVDGCDSTVTTNLTVLPAYSSSQTFNICAGESVSVGDSTYSATGTYLTVLTSVDGCDSTVTTNLAVAAPVTATVSLNQGVLQALPAGALYQWLDCDNTMSPISQETNQDFTPGVNGNYAVEVTVGGCADVSDCEAYDLVSLDENTVSEIDLFPNPTTGQFTVSLNGTVVSRVTVVDAAGRIVKVIDEVAGNELTIDLKKEQNGLYFVQLQVGNDLQTLRMIKE
ncbi:MAG TPA: T9SS type A sorting domain-containing protein [Fluviicola sp.]|nr:T9SS type A sorting domain-containing protein [Fluviicola sp.]